MERARYKMHQAELTILYLRQVTGEAALDLSRARTVSDSDLRLDTFFLIVPATYGGHPGKIGGVRRRRLSPVHDNPKSMTTTRGIRNVAISFDTRTTRRVSWATLRS